MQTNTAGALNFMSSLLLCAVHFFKYAYSSVTLRFLKIQKIRISYFFVSNAVFITVNNVKNVKDDIPAKIVAI